MRTRDEIEQRLAQIQEEINAPDADLDALEQETRTLTEELNQLDTAEARRAEIRNAIAGGAGVTQRSFRASEPRRYDASSPEYRRAFLNTLLGRELSQEERAAYVATTANSAAVLPTTMADRIWDLMEEQHSILGDVTIYRTGTILEVPVRSAITQGDAASVNENAANSDETNTFTKVTLSGKDFSKHVDVSYALDKMSIDGFEQYLTNEIAERLGAAMAADVITQIGTDMASGNAVTAAAAAITYPEVASAFAKLERVNEIVVYARSSTIYSQLVGMVDLQKRPIFQIAAQDGPTGYLIGAKVKREDAVADGVLLIGDPKRVVYNMVQDIMIETDRDIKKHVKTYSGYARGQGKLVDSKSFAKLTPAST